MTSINWDLPLEGVNGEQVEITMFPYQQWGDFSGCYDVKVGETRRTVNALGVPCFGAGKPIIRNRKPVIKTAADMLDRMEDLVRKMAQISGDVGLHFPPNSGAFEAYTEARAIVAELPPVVDADLVVAREIVATLYEAGNNGAVEHKREWAKYCRRGSYDGELSVQAALEGLRRAREEGVK